MGKPPMRVDGVKLLRAWDAGDKHARKRLLTDFIAAGDGLSGTELAAKYGDSLSLLLTRLATWLRLCGSMGAYHPVQLKAVGIFAAGGMLREVVDSGALTGVVTALSDDRCTAACTKAALQTLHWVAIAGRVYKELLCTMEVVGYVGRCAVRLCDRPTVLTLCKALLLELGEANPSYRDAVVRGSVGLLSCAQPRVQALACSLLRQLLASQDASNVYLRPLCLAPLAAILSDPDQNLEVIYEAALLGESFVNVQAVQLPMAQALVACLFALLETRVKVAPPPFSATRSAVVVPLAPTARLAWSEAGAAIRDAPQARAVFAALDNKVKARWYHQHCPDSGDVAFPGLIGPAGGPIHGALSPQTAVLHLLRNLVNDMCDSIPETPLARRWSLRSTRPMHLTDCLEQCSGMVALFSTAVLPDSELSSLLALGLMVQLCNVGPELAAHAPKLATTPLWATFVGRTMKLPPAARVVDTIRMLEEFRASPWCMTQLADTLAVALQSQPSVPSSRPASVGDNVEDPRPHRGLRADAGSAAGDVLEAPALSLFVPTHLHFKAAHEADGALPSPAGDPVSALFAEVTDEGEEPAGAMERLQLVLAAAEASRRVPSAADAPHVPDNVSYRELMSVVTSGGTVADLIPSKPAPAPKTSPRVHAKASPRLPLKSHTRGPAASPRPSPRSTMTSPRSIMASPRGSRLPLGRMASPPLVQTVRPRAAFLRASSKAALTKDPTDAAKARLKTQQDQVRRQFVSVSRSASMGFRKEDNLATASPVKSRPSTRPPVTQLPGEVPVRSRAWSRRAV